MAEIIVQDGCPLKYGAIVTDKGVNFSLYSKDAKKVELVLFEKDDDKSPSTCITFDPVKNKTGDIWHVFLCGLKAGALYLYRVDGEYNPPTFNLSLTFAASRAAPARQNITLLPTACTILPGTSSKAVAALP